MHSLSERATDSYERVRGKVARFLNANEKEVVFTSGATESLNVVAFGLAHKLKRGDEIVLSRMEHHANLVPWQEVAKRTGAVLKFIEYDDDFILDVEDAKKKITSKTKVVCLVHVSNVLGCVNDVKAVAEIAHGVGAEVVVDGAQSVPHMRVDVKRLDCDYLVFSSHKMCGPAGVGVLFGKKRLLEELHPFFFGGDMIYEVDYCSSTYNEVPYRFEAGTPNIEGVIGFGVAIDYLQGIGMEKIERWESELCKYFLKRVKEVEGLHIYGPAKHGNRAAVFSFNIEGVHSHDMSTILDKEGIAIRGGHHCAMPLMGVLDVPSTSRVSLYFYNTFEEIDFIVDVLKRVKKIYENGEFLL
jgi:cysteine desulfurase/selenocysteine lyase